MSLYNMPKFVRIIISISCPCLLPQIIIDISVWVFLVLCSTHLKLLEKHLNILFLLVVADTASVVVISALILDQQMQVSRHDVYTLFLPNCWVSTLQDHRVFSISSLAFREPWQQGWSHRREAGCYLNGGKSLYG